MEQGASGGCGADAARAAGAGYESAPDLSFLSRDSFHDAIRRSPGSASLAHGAYPNPSPSAPQDGAPGQGRYGFATTVEPAVLSAALAAIKTAKALDRVHARLP